MQTVMIYLIGLSGTGKYTIAKEISRYGYKIIDNHLINNPILSLINLDGVTPVPQKAWEAIGQIAQAVFDFIAQDHSTSYVLTNELIETDQNDRAHYNKVLQLAHTRNALFVPVKLLISKEERLKRIASPGRAERFKSTEIEEYAQNKKLIIITHQNLVELNVTDLSAQQAAEQIMLHVAKKGQ